MNELQLNVTETIDRPIAEVVAQFADIQYHSTRTVHEGIKITLLESTEKQRRYRQEFSILGFNQVEEVICDILGPAHLRTKVLQGRNQGMTIDFAFCSTRDNATQVTVNVWTSLHGFQKLIKPLLARTIKYQIARILKEDKTDLERLRYGHYQAGNN